MPTRESSPWRLYGKYVSVESILQSAADKETPLLVICDEISDPPITWERSSVLPRCRGPRRGDPQAPQRGIDGCGGQDLGGRCGPYAWPVCPYPALLKDLKKQGVWVFGTAADTTYDADLKGACGYRHWQRGRRH